MIKKITFVALAAILAFSVIPGAMANETGARRSVNSKATGATVSRKLASKNSQSKTTSTKQKPGGAPSMAEQMKKNPKMKM